MGKNRVEKALEVLNYWKILELLKQEEFPKCKEQNKGPRKEVCRNIHKLTIDVKTMLEDDDKKYINHKVIGDSISYCVGNIKREEIIKYLDRNIKNNIYTPEVHYGTIAWFSFKTTSSGTYCPGSFQLSPILWAISQWRNYNRNKYELLLDEKQYALINKEINDELNERNVSEFMEYIYNKIYEEYVKYIVGNTQQKVTVFCAYSRYSNYAKKTNDQNKVNYTNLGKSNYVNDISLLSKLIISGEFGTNSSYEKNVISYILAAYEKSKGLENIKRVVISPKEPIDAMKGLFDNLLTISKSPKGKWPSSFMPALMQQLAVNIAIQDNDETCVFSVNGPPGTGKTTLLKEIVASNIVERAKLIADNGPNPDDLFEKHTYKQVSSNTYNNSSNSNVKSYYSIKNDKINNYSMLVASCNNKAVENITKDLPKDKEIMKILSCIDKEDELHTQTSDNSNDSKQQDAFFKKYTTDLIGDGCWGLISAPLGNKNNIDKYCDYFLKPYINDSKNDDIEYRKKKFNEVRSEFLLQYHLVETLQKELEMVCQHYRSESVNQSISNNDFYDPSDEKSKLKIFKMIKCLLNKAKNNRNTKSNNQKWVYENYLMEKYSTGENQMTPLDDLFMRKYVSDDLKESTEAQVTDPWVTPKYNKEREKLFLYACKLHEEFVRSSKCMQENIDNFLIARKKCVNTSISSSDLKVVMPHLIQSLFLLTPVISTTFASVQNLLRDIEHSGLIGNLIIDEAGQAQPQEALGALFRSRKAIIVGDPKQIEPVVTDEINMIQQLFTSELLSCYKDKSLSVQKFADYINPYGTYLGKDEEREWVGCPLIVHRRCINPMYTISNTLSYDGTMKLQTKAPDESLVESFILDDSYWIDVCGEEVSEPKNHFVNEQGEAVIKLLKKKFENEKDTISSIFIITPFTTVKAKILDKIKRSSLYENPKVKEWIEEDNIGTVHTFQGRDADEVIFLLGCDRKSVFAANWVSKNIVNVAVTRAKYRLYIIGDQAVWENKSVRIARECIGKIIKEEELDDKLLNLQNNELKE